MRLAAVLLLAVTATAHAREPDRAAPLDVVINGERYGVHLVDRDAAGQWCIGSRELAAWRVAVDPAVGGCIALSGLPGARAEARCDFAPTLASAKQHSTGRPQSVRTVHPVVLRASRSRCACCTCSSG